MKAEKIVFTEYLHKQLLYLSKLERWMAFSKEEKFQTMSVMLFVSIKFSYFDFDFVFIIIQTNFKFNIKWDRNMFEFGKLM